MSEEKTAYTADETKPAPGETKIPTPALSEEEQKLADAVTQLDQANTLLTARDAELTEAKKRLDAQAGDIIALTQVKDDAVAAYRKLAVSTNPVFSEELITGASIAEVDASMKRVADLAAGIKSRIEAELKDTFIPAGAPERSGPDMSGLSPREKIKAGIRKK